MAYTTTRSSPNGSIAIRNIDGAGYGVSEPFPAGCFEPAWGGTDISPYVAYTRTDTDPYGDVAIAHLSRPLRGGGDAGTIPPRILYERMVSDENGRAESHPTWVSAFADTTEETTALFLFTRRALDADVSDVRAGDGATRRELAHRRADDPEGGEVPLDEAGPSHSPDGQYLVYSEEIRTEYGGRRLVIARADGSSPRALDAGPAGVRHRPGPSVVPRWVSDRFHALRGERGRGLEPSRDLGRRNVGRAEGEKPASCVRNRQRANPSTRTYMRLGHRTANGSWWSEPLWAASRRATAARSSRSPESTTLSGHGGGGDTLDPRPRT